MLLSLAYHIRLLEGQVSRWRQTPKQIQLSTVPPLADSLSILQHPDSSSEDSDSDVSDDIVKEVTLGNLKAMTLENISDSWPRHFGRSSNMMMVQTAVKLKKELIGRKMDSRPSLMEFRDLKRYQRPQFWERYDWERKDEPQLPLVFPENDFLHNLVKLYFLHVHPYFPLLHRPSFEKAISEGLHLQNRRFGNVVLSVCAIAARFSDDPRVLVEGAEDNFHSSGWRWFEQASPSRTLLIQSPTLEDLQCCCLSTLYLLGTSLTDSIWVIVGLGIRLAQDMGFHRKKKLRPDGQSSLRTVEGELCTRAFWVLINLDVLLSTAFGRPRATTSDDFDLELPMEIDDEYWENANPAQPADITSRTSFFVYYCKLLEIAGFAQRALYSINRSYFWRKLAPTGPDWQQKAVAEIDSALNQWFASLPEYLRWDSNKEDSIFLRQSAVLHAAYYWTQIQVHGQFIRPSRNGSAQNPSLFESALAICANAARCSVSILEIQHRFQFRLPILFTAPAFAAAIILLICSWTKRSSRTLDASKDLQGVHRCLDLIAMHEHRYQTAGRLRDILKSIINMGNQHFEADSSGGQSTSLRTDELPRNSSPESNASPSFDVDIAGMESGTSSYIPTDPYFSAAAALSAPGLDSGLYSYSPSDSQDWPMDVVSSSFASESEANWSS
ncbi:hypothetical protein GYMLUDRAFT_213322, partial [Collybiopsis luxurians FD-317 M1]